MYVNGYKVHCQKTDVKNLFLDKQISSPIFKDKEVIMNAFHEYWDSLSTHDRVDLCRAIPRAYSTVYNWALGVHSPSIHDAARIEALTEGDVPCRSDSYYTR